MPKSSTKEKKAQRAVEATAKEDAPHAEKPSPKKTTPQQATEVKMTDSASRSGPYVEPDTSGCDTDTPNPNLITGDEDSHPDPTAPRATKPREGGLAAASTSASEPAPAKETPAPSPEEPSNARKAEDVLNSSGTHDPKGSASAITPDTTSQERSPTLEDGPDPVDYEESEPDQDREQGEVTDPNSSPLLTEQQRVTHPGSPMTPKTAAAVAQMEAQAQRESHQDNASTDTPEQEIITNAGIDEGVPPEQLQSDNRRHLSDRSRQEASQAVNTEREREASTPRTREQLLALRYCTLDEYREGLRLIQRPGQGALQYDRCPVVFWDDTGPTRQTNEREFKD
ncbi:unnamed protein product [Phytophthora fragariaefolia]|uniref:Unnamed protein product n=1 Tax=Phytophthora fragariaefolia TaxID=1490495 RepID=A0A9W6Y7Y2_9STRA|nr:unnamed protein product [Phytophthora fragariaefolia]